jgi:hypothetical protein
VDLDLSHVVSFAQVHGFDEGSHQKLRSYTKLRGPWRLGNALRRR